MGIVKAILSNYPNWTINDVLNTDVKYLYEIVLNNKKTKKQKTVRPLSELVKGGR